ncbi:MAG: tetratricopeptide repeat protein [Paludibacteraceae bacterium]|nr:tetratricopeptide repeat protein [Paludibacteraceae bacterium]
MRRLLFTFITLILTITSGYGASKAVVASTIQLPEQEVVYNEGIDLLKKGLYDEAIIKFTASVTIDPNFTKAYYNRAVAYFNQEKYTKAIADIETALNQFSKENTSDCYVLLSKANYCLGNIPESIEYIDKALEINPSNIQAMLDKGGVLQLSEQYEKAIEVYNSIIYHTRGNAAAYNEQGNCFLALEDTDRAYECYNKAHKAAPDSTKFAYNLAVATWQAKHDTINSIEILNTLIASEPDNADYYNAKGYIYAQSGDYGRAIDNFNIAILFNKNLASAYNGKGAVLCKTEMYDDALTEFNKAIEANTNYGDAYVNRGITKEYLGDYDGACNDYKKGVELGAKNAQKYYQKQCD